VIEAELYKFFSNGKRLLGRTLFFYRPAPVMLVALLVTRTSPWTFLYATTAFYSSFISIVFIIYRLPGRLSKDLAGPAMFELVYVDRARFFISRLVATLIITTMMSLFPILSVFFAASPMIGLKKTLIAPILAFLTSVYALSPSSIGLVMSTRRNPAYALTITYLLIISSTALPYILYMLFHSPKYLAMLIVSPGFAPAMATYYTFIRLGAHEVTNEIWSLYASQSGRDPYYPGALFGIVPLIVYLVTFLLIFRIRFREADL